MPHKINLYRVNLGPTAARERGPEGKGCLRKNKHLHGNSDNAVCGIPEAHVSGIWSTLWRPPRHHCNEYLDEDKEDDKNVPGAEVCPLVADAFVAVAYDVEANTKEDVEDGFRVNLEADDCCWVSQKMVISKAVMDLTYRTGMRLQLEARRSSQKS